MALSTLIQSQIEATQLLDDIEYGLRSMKACGGGMYCTGPHAGQLSRAAAAAGYILDTPATAILNDGNGAGCALKLREAREFLRECLKDAKAEAKTYGTPKQRKLALAGETHEFGLAA